MGAKEEYCNIVGNLKFDISMPSYSQEEKEAYRKELKLNTRKLWVAGSTRTGEYEILLEAFQQLEDYTLVIVPRHLERVPEIESLLKEKRFLIKSIQTKKNEKILQCCLWIKWAYYGSYIRLQMLLCGGNFGQYWGHSLLEPLAYGKTPILVPILKM